MLRGKGHEGLLLSDALDLLLDGKPIHGRNRKRGDQRDALRDCGERLLIRPFNLFGCTVYRSRIGNTPTSGHRLPRLERTDLMCRVITDRENKSEMRGLGSRKLFPRFASESLWTKPCDCDLTEGFRSHRSCWMASCTVGGKSRPSATIHDGFSHDRAAGVTSAKKQYVIVRHSVRP